MELCAVENTQLPETKTFYQFCEEHCKIGVFVKARTALTEWLAAKGGGFDSGQGIYLGCVFDPW